MTHTYTHMLLTIYHVRLGWNLALQSDPYYNEMYELFMLCAKVSIDKYEVPKKQKKQS